MFLVRCPNCKNDMKVAPKDGLLTSKSKRCVYCGRSFRVHPNITEGPLKPQNSKTSNT